MQCRLRDRRSRLSSLGLRPCPLRTEIPPDSLNLLIMLCTVEGEISKSLPIFLWGTLFLNISIIFSRICWQTGDPRPIFAPKGLDLSWMLLLYQIIITITCWHQLFQITSLFNQFTSLLALNCSCPNFFWNVLQVWMTGKDVYLQMTWSWPDKTWNILCSYCLQWNTSQSKFRNHYFLFLFAFSILSQLFLIWGCRISSNFTPSSKILLLNSQVICFMTTDVRKQVKCQTVSQLIMTLSSVAKHVFFLAGEFPALQSRMRAVLRVEVEAVKFLKEEPHKLDSMLKRVRTLTDTLSNLRRYRLRAKEIETDVSIANIIRLWLIKYFMTNFMDLYIFWFQPRIRAARAVWKWICSFCSPSFILIVIMCEQGLCIGLDRWEIWSICY